MAVYTFNLFRAGSTALSVDFAELPNDAAAFGRAGELLVEHQNSAFVEVWDSERPVVSRHREQPIIRPVEAAPHVEHS